MKEQIRYIIGIDLGQSYDYTVLSILIAKFNMDGKLEYDLVYLKRFALKKSYMAIIDEVIGIVDLYDLKGNYAMAIDYTGVGHPVFDFFVAKGLHPLGITITGGTNVNRQTNNTVTVPKKDIVTYLQIVLQTRRLRIAHNLSLLDEMRKELLSFQFKIGSNAKGSFNASSGMHDDIVMSLGVAIWTGEYHTKKKLKVIGGQ